MGGHMAHGRGYGNLWAYGLWAGLWPLGCVLSHNESTAFFSPHPLGRAYGRWAGLWHIAFGRAYLPQTP